MISRTVHKDWSGLRNEITCKNTDVDKRIILSEFYKVAGFCKYSNEYKDSITRAKFPHYEGILASYGGLRSM
jgi:hypothetical protein